MSYQINSRIFFDNVPMLYWLESNSSKKSRRIRIAICHQMNITYASLVKRIRILSKTFGVKLLNGATDSLGLLNEVNLSLWRILRHYDLVKRNLDRYNYEFTSSMNIIGPIHCLLFNPYFIVYYVYIRYLLNYLLPTISSFLVLVFKSPYHLFDYLLHRKLS